MPIKTTLNLDYIMNTIRHFYRQHDRLPSLQEIADLFGYNSRSSAVHVVNRLIKKNFLKKDGKGKLLSSSCFHNRIKLLGMVSAGFPTPEEEELLSTISLDDYLISKPQATFMLEVKGDSMTGAGILPKDLVLVEKGRVPRPGDIVIAQVDGDWTMKYYRKEKSTVYLEAANPRYKNIYPKEELNIGGIVVSVLRKY